MATEFDISREVGSETSRPFGLIQGDWTYPVSGDLIYGTDFAHSDFVIPIIRFSFYDATGKASANAPTIYAKMGGQFQSNLSNPFQAAQNIYGSPGDPDAGAFDVVKRYGEGFYTALQKQVLGGIAGVTGAFASAGQSGKSNVEFLQRKMFNNFQQLIYSGPNFRTFNLPFPMKATSYEEAKNIRNIISTFRIASSPQVGSEIDSNQGLDESVDEGTLGGSGTDLSQQSDQASQTAAPITATEYDALVNASFSTKVFGYPDMCRFQLLLYQKDGNEFPVLFESDLCVIESVAVDYGGQNKMTFFEDSKGNGEYYPTDVSLTIALKETSLVTSSFAYEESKRQTRTML
jgi:hypothetical protein